MFGLIVSGRPVDANPQAISETQYAFRIVPSPPFGNIVVFLLPGTTFPPDTAASVYIQIPSEDFRLVGAIGPGKESAIFKVNKAAIEAAAGSVSVDSMLDVSAMPSVVVGLSIEPAAQVEAQILQMKSGQIPQSQPSNALVPAQAAPVSSTTTRTLAQKIGRNAFNYLSSFGTDNIPLKAFQDWWVKFEKRLELDPNFLDKDQG